MRVATHQGGRGAHALGHLAGAAHRTPGVLGTCPVADEVRLGCLVIRRGGRRGRAPGHGERHERIADVDRLALPRVQFGDDARVRRRKLDEGLGGLHLGDDLVELDGIPFGDAPGDDVGFGQALAEVGQPELAQRHGVTTGLC